MSHRLRIPAAGVGRTTDELLAEFHRRTMRRNVSSAAVSDGALVILFNAAPDEVEKRARYIFCDVARWPNNNSAIDKYEVVSEAPAEPVLPMPNDTFDGGTVIASVWQRDDPPWTAALMLLMPEPPYYRVVDIEWWVPEIEGRQLAGTWSVVCREAMENINPATQTYAEHGGDY